MRVYISCDIEGVSCVVRPEHSRIDGRDYIQSRRLMTGEVNAAIQGAFDAGATEVVVNDAHNVGLNLLPEELDERAQLIMGTPRPLSMMEGVEQGFDAVFLVGYHSMPLTENGVIEHNFHGRVRFTRFNGQILGELGMNAALAGLYGAPVALVTGDEVTMAEARALLPWVETVAVKRGIGCYAAQCLHPKTARARIYEGAKAAVARLAEMKPFTVAEPVRMEMEVTTASTADRLARIPGFRRVDATTMAAENISYRDAYDVFLTATDLVDMVPFI